MYLDRRCYPITGFESRHQCCNGALIVSIPVVEVKCWCRWRLVKRDSVTTIHRRDHINSRTLIYLPGRPQAHQNDEHLVFRLDTGGECVLRHAAKAFAIFRVGGVMVICEINEVSSYLNRTHPRYREADSEKAPAGTKNERRSR